MSDFQPGNNKRLSLRTNKSRYNFYIKKNLRELFLLLFPNLDELEVQIKNQPFEEGLPEIVTNFYNILCLKFLFFIVFGAKILDMFLFPCYYYGANGPYLKTSTQQMKMRPLFFSTRWDVSTVKQSFRFLFSDFLKLIKMLGLELSSYNYYNGFQDFFDVINLLQKHLFGKDSNM